MPRCMAGDLSAGAGSTTLPLMSVYSPANNGFKLRECGVTNTTDTSLAVALCRLTSAGTQGSGLTEASYDENYTPLATAFNTHSGGPTIVDAGYRAQIPAAKGAGVVWVFGDSGLVVPKGTANGVGVYIENGTGQVCQVYFVWDE